MPAPASAAKIESLRARVAEIREHAQELFQQGANGLQTATVLADGLRQFAVDVWMEALQSAGSPEIVSRLEQYSAVVAVGGTGRGELAPYSDLDLLFLYQPSVQADFMRAARAATQDLWDSGLKLGESKRTLRDSIAFAIAEPQFATSLIEARWLWGSQELVERLQRKFERSVIRKRRSAFIETACVGNRQDERTKFGGAVQQLEPDVKSSWGGLRDLHLLRWVGFAFFGSRDIDSLRLRGELSREDARSLIEAQEYLTKIRIDLHFAAGKAHDRLTRDEQLRIATERGVERTPAQSPVELFMQEYFRHTTAVADIVSRFIARHRQPPWWRRFYDLLMMRRQDGCFLVGAGRLTVARSQQDTVCSDFLLVLRLFETAARQHLEISPRVLEHIRLASPNFSRAIMAEHSRVFLSILDQRGSLGKTLRAMFSTGVLEVLLPEFTRIRNLTQFNQYHHYTVDEHTFQAVERAEAFENASGPIHAAYRGTNIKWLLHLTVLLHDIGKGQVEDHCLVGERIAETVAIRFGLTEPHRKLLMFLVRWHLEMADVALRRDTSDQRCLSKFTHLVGSPEWLTILYLLTVADISAVGPDIWNDWKAGLLNDLYDRSMLLLSGKMPGFLEQERMRVARDHAAVTLAPPQATQAERVQLVTWLNQHLLEFPAHYLAGTSVERITADLDIIRRLQPGEIIVEGNFDPGTDTVDYRIVTDRQHAVGCFHRIAGTLTSQRLEILSAQICTTQDGTVVDVFRVRDDDFAGPVPPDRIAAIGQAIRRVLRQEIKVDELFQRSKRFRWQSPKPPASGLPNRVSIDNDSSNRATILGIFAHDRPGLLYTVSRAIYRLELSIDLAIIATHLDQIHDVFYVTDRAGQKLTDEARLASIQLELTSTLAEFDATGHQRFIG